MGKAIKHFNKATSPNDVCMIWDIDSNGLPATYRVGNRGNNLRNSITSALQQRDANYSVFGGLCFGDLSGYGYLKTQDVLNLNYIHVAKRVLPCSSSCGKEIVYQPGISFSLIHNLCSSFLYMFLFSFSDSQKSESRPPSSSYIQKSDEAHSLLRQSMMLYLYDVKKETTFLVITSNPQFASLVESMRLRNHTVLVATKGDGSDLLKCIKTDTWEWNDMLDGHGPLIMPEWVCVNFVLTYESICSVNTKSSL